VWDLQKSVISVTFDVVLFVAFVALTDFVPIVAKSDSTC
jgi:hypothetical protein